MSDRKLLLERLERLAIVLDEIMPRCAELVRDAVTMLKEREAVTEYVMDDYYQPICKACGFRPFVMYIPTREWMKERGFKYCPHCGRVVKWDV